MKRLGFACKLSQLDDSNTVQSVASATTKSTTISWIKRQSKQVAESKLEELVKHNMSAVYNLVSAVAVMPELFRMVRITSDVLPVYTHPDWSYFYQSATIQNFLKTNFAKIGELARSNGVRLSFHPGQFCCIVSNNPGIVENSLAELEYHARMAEWMGYGKKRLDFKINIHLSGKLGIDGFLTAYNQMSPLLRSSLTLENDEYQAGLNALLPLSPYVGIVLDIHHHFINSGEYIEADDKRMDIVRESWRGMRPVIHYSQSDWQYLQHFSDQFPQLEELLKHAPRSKLRAHSEFYNHKKLNNWALTFLDTCDIMTESKSKNIGAVQVAESLK